jgi:hypothetical protein
MELKIRGKFKLKKLKKVGRLINLVRWISSVPKIIGKIG